MRSNFSYLHLEKNEAHNIIICHRFTVMGLKSRAGYILPAWLGTGRERERERCPNKIPK